MIPVFDKISLLWQTITVFDSYILFKTVFHFYLIIMRMIHVNRKMPKLEIVSHLDARVDKIQREKLKKPPKLYFSSRFKL